jgi:hypothetical protein
MVLANLRARAKFTSRKRVLLPLPLEG